MKGAEITDIVLDSIENKKHNFIRINYPNGDMVGHTGDLLAVEISVETVDMCVGRLIDACLLYTSPSPRDLSTSRMPSSA